MTRMLSGRGHTFTGGDPRRHDGPFEINGKPVGRVMYRVTWDRAFGEAPEPRGRVARAAGMRGRKRALDARRALTGCDHEFEYREDTIGADDVINGTYTDCWLECLHCGAQRGASSEDAPDYGEGYF